MLRIRGWLEFTFFTRFQAIFPHNSAKPVLGCSKTPIFEVLKNPGHTICFLTFLMWFFDLYRQFSITTFMLAGRWFQPRIIAALRHLHNFNHFLYHIHAAMFFHELVFLSPGFEKMATTFFNMSRSIFVSDNSFLRRTNSSSRGFPWPGKGLTFSLLSSLFHLDSAPDLMPRSSAIVFAVFPLFPAVF